MSVAEEAGGERAKSTVYSGDETKQKAERRATCTVGSRAGRGTHRAVYCCDETTTKRTKRAKRNEGAMMGSRRGGRTKPEQKLRTLRFSEGGASVLLGRGRWVLGRGR
mmetsp:Transcript_16177/g.48925  ORF Transcript_16177/g.48925 Transcript_16177/m.48925 type:complete len:108 (-) Transcript_16177:1147-1470(-)